MLDAVALSALLKDKNVAHTAEKIYGNNELLKKNFDGKLRNFIPREEEDGAADYRSLFSKASAPWLTNIAGSHSQILSLDGWTGEDDRLWKAFLKNGWKSKQSFTISEALTYGYSYILILPSEEKGMAVVEPMSATNTFVLFQNSWDIYPIFALQKLSENHWVFVDNEAVYDIEGTPGSIDQLTISEHNLGFCPVVRVDEQACTSTQLPKAPFEGAVTTAQALTEARFHMLHIGRKATFPRLWATGIKPEGDETNGQEVGDIYAVESDLAKFGAFPQADANGIINIVNALQTQLAILTNTPPHMMPVGGTIANLSAEALTSLEQNYLRVSERRKASMGQGFNDVLRTMAYIMGIEVSDDATVHWDNIQTTSLSQLGDFISKVSVTGIPLEPLYQMIPGFDKGMADKSATWAYDHQKASNAGALIDTDIKRAELAKIYVDMGFTKEEAINMADNRNR